MKLKINKTTKNMFLKSVIGLHPNQPNHFLAQYQHKRLYRVSKNRKNSKFNVSKYKEISEANKAFNYLWLIVPGFISLASSWFMLKNANSDNKINDFRMLLNAIEKNNIQEVKDILKKIPSTLQAVLTEDGLTPLLVSVKHGHYDLVKVLVEEFLKNKVSEDKDREGNNALLIAAIYGHRHIMEYLLEKGCLYNSCNRNSENLLILATWRNHISMVEWIIKHPTYKKLLDYYDKFGWYPIHVAVYTDNLILTKIFLENNKKDAGRVTNWEGGADKDNYIVYSAATPLHIAVNRGYLNIVKYLVEDCKANIEAQLSPNQHEKAAKFFPACEYTCTPLLLAVKTGQFEILKYLISKGAKLDVKDYIEHNTALLLAARNGHTAVVDYLLNLKQDIEQKNYYGETAIIAAISGHHYDTVECLLLNGAALSSADRNKKTIKDFASNDSRLKFILEKYSLRDAIKKGDTKIVRESVKNNPGLLSECDYHGQLPLHLACKNNTQDIVEVLVDQGVDLKAKDRHSKTAFIYAVENSNIAILDFLIKSYHNDKECIFGLSTITSAINLGKKDVLDFLLMKSAKNDVVEYKDNKKNNLLHFAVSVEEDNAEQQQYIIVKKLIGYHKGFTNGANAEGLLPVHIAAKKKNSKLIECFDEHHLKEQTKDSYRYTPLHIACQNKNVEVVKFLCTKIDNLEILEAKDGQGKTPQDYIYYYRNFPIENQIYQYIETARRRIKNTLSSMIEVKTTPQIKGLAFQGGGVKGFAYLGALDALQQQGVDLNKVKIVAGTSVGAITALLVGLGFGLPELESKLHSLNLVKLIEADGGPKIDELQKVMTELKGQNGIWQKLLALAWNPRSIWDVYKSLVSDHGVYEGKSFLLWIEDTIQEGLKRNGIKNIENITFKEWHDLVEKYPKMKDIYIVGANLTKQECEVFSYNTTPNMLVADSIRISMSLPFIFKPHKPRQKNLKTNKVESYNNNLYIDGGVIYNYPIHTVEQYLPKVEVLGLRLISSSYEDEKNGSNQEIVNFIDFSLRFVSIFLKIQEFFYKSNKTLRDIEIDIKDFSAVEFNLTPRDKEYLHLLGEKAVNDHIKQNPETLYGINQTSLGILSKLSPSIREEKQTANHIYLICCVLGEQDINAIKNFHLNYDIQDPKTGDTALHIAAELGQIDCLSNLLALGANPKIQNNSKHYPIDIAAKHNKVKIITSILQTGHYECSNDSRAKIEHLLTLEKNKKDKNSYEYQEIEKLLRDFNSKNNASTKMYSCWENQHSNLFFKIFIASDDKKIDKNREKNYLINNFF